MRRFYELSDDQRELAVLQATAILMEGSIPTMDDATDLAEEAYYPEQDDVILFLPVSPLFTLEETLGGVTEPRVSSSSTTMSRWRFCVRKGSTKPK